MDHVRAMCDVERTGRLLEDAMNLVHLEPTSHALTPNRVPRPHTSSQRCARDAWHHHENEVLRRANEIHRDNVWMAQVCEDRRLTLKAN